MTSSVLDQYLKIKQNSRLCDEKSEQFFKKLLIYMITLLKLMNEYISLKISKKKITFKLSPVAYMIELSKQFNADAMRNKIKVDAGLESQSLSSLLDQINVEDLRSYLVLNHVYIYKNNQNVEVTLNHKGRDLSFVMTKKEQRDVLCCRTKRKDELVKMSFKFIKRKILREFQTQVKSLSKKNAKEGNRSRVSWKKQFYSKFFNNDQTGIKFFEFFDLSKKRLETLKRFEALVGKLKDFQDQLFIREMIREYIVEQSKNITDSGLTLDKFVSGLLSRQQKHSMVVQHVLNALNEFNAFFQF